MRLPLPASASAVAFRNILVHGYADVDDRLVRDLIESKLPACCWTLRYCLANRKDRDAVTGVAIPGLSDVAAFPFGGENGKKCSRLLEGSPHAAPELFASTKNLT